MDVDELESGVSKDYWEEKWGKRRKILGECGK